MLVVGNSVHRLFLKHSPLDCMRNNSLEVILFTAGVVTASLVILLPLSVTKDRTRLVMLQVYNHMFVFLIIKMLHIAETQRALGSFDRSLAMLND
jgi:hypothetical protein